MYNITLMAISLNLNKHSIVYSNQGNDKYYDITASYRRTIEELLKN